MLTDVFIFRIGQLGDTLVALPAVHRVAELHPNTRLWLITNAPAHRSMVTAWDVLKHTRLFHGVLFYDRHNPWHLVSLAARCRLARKSILYYLSPPRSAARLRRDRIFFRVACGFRQIAAVDERIRLTTRDANGKLVRMPRESERLLRNVDPIGAPPQPPYLKPEHHVVKRVDQWLSPLGARPLIAVGPGSKMPAKKWFLERYVEVCKRITEHHPTAAVVVFGGAEDRAAGDTIIQAVGVDRGLNLAGVTDIIESAAAMSRCNMYIGNDTGTMHLAATMGLPCIAIFTSRDNRDTWSPWGDSHVILRRDLPCSGCMLERCEREQMRCLDLIGVDDVWREVEPRLAHLAVRDTERRMLSSRHC